MKQFKRIFNSGFIIAFYVIGLLGFAIPYTRGFFISITPVSLVFVFFLILFVHRPFSLNLVVALVVTALAGFAVEVAGVDSGRLFGQYHYGEVLGPKLLNTPLLIGFNWAMLIFCALAIAQSIKAPPLIHVLLVALLMTGYDLALEPFAIKTSMWSWSTGIPPVKNYIAWFVVSLIMAVLWTSLRIKVKNSLAVVLFFSQIIFFILSVLIINLIQP